MCLSTDPEEAKQEAIQNASSAYEAHRAKVNRILFFWVAFKFYGAFILLVLVGKWVEAIKEELSSHTHGLSTRDSRVHG